MRLIYILLAVLLIFTSCEKEKKLDIWGKWVLVDGHAYVENMETYEKIKYQHFGAGKTVSALTVYNQPSYNLEIIEQDVTTWEFLKNGDFILNDDYEHPMAVDYGQYNKTIIEHPTADEPDEIQLGGSAKPFSAYTYDYDSKLIIIQIQEQVGSHNGYNVEWRNELVFRKVE
jgi:hypothetical protein